MLRAIAVVEGAARWRDLERWMATVLGPSIGMSSAERWHRMGIAELTVLCEAVESCPRRPERRAPREDKERAMALLLFPPNAPRSVAPAVLRVGPAHSFESLRARLRRHPPTTPARPPGHRCHARGCPSSCPPRHLMCGRHWRMVPTSLQQRVWSAYRPGQEEDKEPSATWVRAADMAIDAVAQVEVIRKSRYL